MFGLGYQPCLQGIQPACLGLPASVAILSHSSYLTIPAQHNLAVLQEFNIEKLQLLEAEKAKIRKDYERREGQIDVKKKM